MYFRYILVIIMVAASAMAELKMAVMTTGDVHDFGWSNRVNSGRVQMEHALNISGTRWVPNIDDRDHALHVIINDLVPSGFNLIVSTTLDHGDAPSVAAEMFPNVYFVQTPKSDKNLPNLGGVNLLSIEFYYLLGFFSGLVTTNNKTGMVIPGSQPHMANAFYVGAKNANPNAEVYVIFTGSFLNADLALGAAKVLVEDVGVTAISQQQDDFTVQAYAMSRGLLATGSNGYPLKELFGELVGTSGIRNWTRALSHFARLVRDGNWKSDNIEISMRSGDQTMEEVSYRVSAEKAYALKEEIRNLTGGGTPYLCSEYLSEIGFDNGKCVTMVKLRSATYVSGIIQMGKYVMPVHEIPISSQMKTAFYTLFAVLVVVDLAIVVAIFVTRHRDLMLIRSIPYRYMMMFGIIICHISMLMWLQEPDNNHVCNARVWMMSLGYLIMISILIVKNYITSLVLTDPIKYQHLSTTTVHITVLVLIAVDVILLAFYTAFSGEQSVQLFDANGIGKYNYVWWCSNKQEGLTVLYVILGLHALVIAFGCYVSLKQYNTVQNSKNTVTQDIAATVSEVRSIATAMFSNAFCVVVVGLLVIDGTDIFQINFIMPMATAATTTATTVILFGEFVLNLITGRRLADNYPSKNENCTDMSSSFTVSRGAGTAPQTISMQE